MVLGVIEKIYYHATKTGVVNSLAQCPEEELGIQHLTKRPAG